MTHASRSILTRSPSVSAKLRIPSPFPIPPSGTPLRDFPAPCSLCLRPIQPLSPLESALTKNAPVSPLESALTEYPGGWRTPYLARISAPRPHMVVTPLESALTKNAPASPLESALPEYPGGGGAFASSLRGSALSASQRYPCFPSSFPSHRRRPAAFSTFNCRLSTSHTTMLKSYRRLYDHP